MEERNEQAIDGGDELIRLVASNADVTSQYVVFRNGYDELYAVNVAKVEELIVNKDLNIAQNSQQGGMLIGTAKIREEMCSIVHFDRWLGKGEADGCVYELIVVCNFGHQRVGVVIKNVIGIQNIEASKLIDNSTRDHKAAQITELHIGKENKLCVVFNSDALLAEVFPEAYQNEINKIERLEKVKGSKKILFADDSRIVQKAVEAAFRQMGVEYEIFDNGKELLDRLYSMSIDDVGLIISDIEMPIMDGMSLLREVKNNAKTGVIPFIINTNMANPSIAEQAKRYGVDYVIHKLDVDDLRERIRAFARA